MNRRGFLGSMLAAASMMVLDPEKLLWRPGEKTIFIPEPSTLMVPVRQIFGVRLDTGMIVYCDEVVRSGCIVEHTERETGKILSKCESVHPKDPTPFWMPPFWVQTVGTNRVFGPSEPHLETISFPISVRGAATLS